MAPESRDQETERKLEDFRGELAIGVRRVAVTRRFASPGEEQVSFLARATAEECFV
jgi:hypothetical protein